MKNIMWKYFTANNTSSYLDALNQMVKNYNDSTIKMAPKEACKDINQGKVYFNILRKQNKSRANIKNKKAIKSVSANIKGILKRDVPPTG